MPEEGDVAAELEAHDVTRIWELALMIYDGDDPDADLRTAFATATNIYVEFMNDLAAGGTVLLDAETGRHLVSDRAVEDGREVVRFRYGPKADASES